MAKILDTKCTVTEQHPQHTKIHTVVVGVVVAAAAVSYVPLVAATATTASCSIKMVELPKTCPKIQTLMKQLLFFCSYGGDAGDGGDGGGPVSSRPLNSPFPACTSLASFRQETTCLFVQSLATNKQTNSPKRQRKQRMKERSKKRVSWLAY
jgi:hypothetical protein